MHEDPGAEALSESLFIVLLPTAGAVILSVLCSPSRLPPASPSLIRTLQHNARRPRQWALCIIQRLVQQHVLALHSQKDHANSMVLENSPHMNKQVHHQQDDPWEIRHGRKGNLHSY